MLTEHVLEKVEKCMAIKYFPTIGSKTQRVRINVLSEKH